MHRRDISNLANLISQLPAERTDNARVYSLKNADAAQLAATLRSVVGQTDPPP